MNENNMEVPKVFISYSHDNKDHIEWVKDLSTKLRSHGVDVILDQWDLEIGKDLRFFMENGLDETTYVICICSELYVKKANEGNGGVGYETTIISSDLLKNTKIDYILPIIKNNQTDKKTPIFLSNKLYIDFDQDKYYDNYLKLIRRIFNRNDKEKPSIGKNPFNKGLHPRISEEVSIRTDIDKSKYSTSNKVGIVKFDYNNNSGVFSIGEGSFLFQTKWSSASNTSIHVYSDLVDKIGFLDEVYEFPEVDELVMFDYTSRSRTINIGEIIIFQNNYGNFLAIKILDIKSKSHGSNKNYLKFEYKIYSF
ncbi:toll/interleukin-1 receptor domain-containing protein [Anaerococcus sp. ENR1011]|uniref:Toll/interleukin-1 receptor domain-containing protein n=1 Tax=Anaerococcus groningensis TaxID=3115616 RepID=A0ABW9MZT9_9FIRM